MCVHAAKILKKMLMVILMTIAFTTKESSCQDGCTDGDVRLVGTPLRSLGVVEVCIYSNWGRVCRDRWDDNDAEVVCNQLGFGRNGALAVWEVPVEDSNFMRGSVVIDGVRCDSTETELLDCSHTRRGYYGLWCSNGGDAGVRCTDKWLQVKNITAATIQASYNNVTRQNILLSWELYNNASYTPSSFSVKCFDRQRHNMELSVNNGTLTQLNIGDLLSTSFRCCVSVIYYHGHYEAEQRCTSTTDSDMLLDLFPTPAPNRTVNQPTTTPSSTQMMPASIGSEKVVGSDLNMRASIVGGVLGSIIIILLLLLAVCGGALLFLLRSRSMTPKTRTVDFPNNSRYVTSSTSGLQAQGTDASTAAADYSRIGPSYEIIDSSRQHQPEAGGRGNVSALVRLSERYEFSEPHLAMAASARPGGDGGGGVGQGEAAALDYEVPLNSSLSQSEGYEAYSRLQH